MTSFNELIYKELLKLNKKLRNNWIHLRLIGIGYCWINIDQIERVSKYCLYLHHDLYTISERSYERLIKRNKSMTKPVARYLQLIYSELWIQFSNSWINFDTIQSYLKESRNTICNYLHELRKSKWLNERLTEKDARQREYFFREPSDIFLEMRKEKTEK